MMRVSEPTVLEYLDHPTEATGWSGGGAGIIPEAVSLRLDTKYGPEELRPGRARGPDIGASELGMLEMAVRHSADVLAASERVLNVLDSEVGDADTGTNMRRAATTLIDCLTIDKTAEHSNPFAFLRLLADTLERRATGLSSLLYALMFAAASVPFTRMSYDDQVDTRAWLRALCCATAAVERYGGRLELASTLQAAAEAAKEVVESGGEGVAAAMAAARAASETAKRTVAPRSQKPDPGAHAAALIMQSVACVLLSRPRQHDTTKVQF